MKLKNFSSGMYARQRGGGCYADNGRRGIGSNRGGWGGDICHASWKHLL